MNASDQGIVVIDGGVLSLQVEGPFPVLRILAIRDPELVRIASGKVLGKRSQRAHRPLIVEAADQDGGPLPEIIKRS